MDAFIGVQWGSIITVALVALCVRLFFRLFINSKSPIRLIDLVVDVGLVVLCLICLPLFHVSARVIEIIGGISLAQLLDSLSCLGWSRRNSGNRVQRT
jgi:hypothetical protein